MLGRLFNRKKASANTIFALNDCLEALGSDLRVEGRVVRKGNRACQVFGRYVDFWENGMKWLGVDCVKDNRQMADLLYYWLDLRMNSKDIERLVPDIEFPESRKRMEEGEESYLEWFWKTLEAKRDRRFGRVIELFARNAQTRRLMSFTRLRDFAFSRVIPPRDGRSDLPFIRITDQWEYEVHIHMTILDNDSSARSSLVGKGSADEAYRMVLAYLPESIGTARYCPKDNERPAA